MPNKTIYVSEKDLSLFEEAQKIAGEALSSVISLALRDYVQRQKKQEQGMKEIAVHVGKAHAEREVRFIGSFAGKWQGLSDDKEWWMSATIYCTQKSNWAVHLVTVCKATLLTNKKAWKENGDYLVDARQAELIVGSTRTDFENKLPQGLLTTLIQLMKKDEKPIEYLDI